MQHSSHPMPVETTTTSIGLERCTSLPQQFSGATSSDFDSTVDPHSMVEGNFQSDGDASILIDGRFRGQIDLGRGSLLVIGAGGVVEDSTVTADFVVVLGAFTGTAHARLALEVMAEAVVDGDLRYGARVTIHSKAAIQGKLSAIPA
ncbi:polymer-forming cytoskeletal protein [Hydrogenophaga sp. D2P1]|uniref:Polymer-forming cytoskeletal protein n=2 Tax=Hydrogenophaga aromaticivorans TaxID=2610898 RepID=A0A7Y8KXM0_9BURK|nr:polymer-forming cytoskeletal protein [Hydrogenophaga aromaticivorans]